MIRAKFVVDHVTRALRAPDTEVRTVVLKPVTGIGEIHLDTSKPEVADQFVLGGLYTVDFNRVD